MRLSLLVLVASASAASIRPFNETEWDALPDCAKHCVDAASTGNQCGIRDTTCFCSNVDITAAFATCLETSCSLPSNALLAERYQAEVCDYPLRTRQPLHRGMLWFTFTLATIFVIFRFLSRAPILTGSGYSWDDHVIFFTYAMAVGILVATEITIHNGSGLDEYRLTLGQIERYMLWTYISELLYNTIIITTKIAVILLYLRIWSTDKITGSFRIASWVIILSLILTGVAFDLGLAFQCLPVSYVWRNIYGGSGQCLNLPALTYTFGAISICYDVLVFFLPIHSLLKLRITWQKKVGVCAVFLMGFVVTICTIVRLQYLVRFSSRNNATWVYQPISMWSIIEANLSIVCCCMPATVGLFQRVWKSWKNESVYVSTGYVARQADLKEPVSSDDQSHAQLVDVENAPALGEKDGRAKLSMEGPGQVSQIQSTASSPSEGTSASAILEEYRQTTQSNAPAKQTALVHQASSKGNQKVEISHEPPSQPAEVQLWYRDVDDVVHQVTLTDVPLGKIPGPSRGGHGASDRTRQGCDLTGLNVKDAAEFPESPYATR